MDFNDAMRELSGMPGRIESVLASAMRRIIKEVAKESKLNAPKSPTQQELDNHRTEIYGEEHTKRIKKLRSLHAKGSSAAKVKAEKTAARKLKRRQKKEERKIMQRLAKQDRTAARRERKREARALKAERRRERKRGRRRTRRRRK